MQDCIICPTPTNHVCNLTEEMGTFTNLEFFIYDPFDLEACYQTENNIINSHATITTDPPPPLCTASNLVLVSNLLNQLLIYMRILTFSR